MQGNGSEEAEAYRLLARGDDFRIGVAVERDEATAPVISMELLVRLFRTGKRLESDEMEAAWKLTRELMGAGYSVYVQGDGWVSCDKTVQGGEVRDEERLLVKLMEGWRP